MNINGPKFFLLLKQKGITITQLAEQIGVTRQTLSRILNDGVIKTKSHLKLITQALSISEDDLLTEQPVPHKESGEEMVAIPKAELDRLKEIENKFLKKKVKKLKKDRDKLKNDPTLSN